MYWVQSALQRFTFLLHKLTFCLQSFTFLLQGDIDGQQCSPSKHRGLSHLGQSWEQVVAAQLAPVVSGLFHDFAVTVASVSN
jgi:hypothetical protein